MSCDARREHLKKEQNKVAESIFNVTKEIGPQRWAVGMTVAYREQTTVKSTLESLALAGWYNPTLFAEPDANDLPEDKTLKVADKNLGAWLNFSRMVRTLAKSKNIDKVLLVQDDVEFIARTRDWIEGNWPTNEGIVSLYRSSRYKVETSKKYDTLGYDKAMLGALAIVMSHDHLVSLSQNLDHLWDNNLKQIDIKLGKFAHALRIPINIVTKSRCQHTGDTSSIYPYARNAGTRRSNTYVASQGCDTKTPKT